MVIEKLNMETKDLSQEHIKQIQQLFPNAITEINKNGKITLGIDFDVLKQELSNELIDEKQERYQMTWPDKKKAMLLANSKINAALRPLKEKSVDFDNTKNIYIEGDNLDVLKLLRETYLNKIKMIYIDPPYNTGNDFVYEDDFAQSTEEYKANSGQYDKQGNRLFQNNESNGRFHTDWLNMMYPRLKIARDLLTDDGVIFISIDDNEFENLKKICDEIFGSANFRNTILTRRRIKSLNAQFSENGLYSMNVGFEYVLVYSKSNEFMMKALRMQKNINVEKGRWDVFWSNADRPTMRYDILGFTPTTGQWRNSKEKAYIAVENYKTYEKLYSDKMTLEEYYKKTGIKDFIRRIPNATGKNGGVQHWIAPSNTSLRTSNWTDIEVSQIGKEIDLPFENPKSRQLIVELIKLTEFTKTDIILDFFSGSATTAHAVIKLNAEDQENRRFIMVQLPELTNNKEYSTICDIGEERIRRAGKKIKEELIEKKNNAGMLNEDIPDPDSLDIGFRVFKLDSSNMNDVYYNPNQTQKNLLDVTIDNIKLDRTGLDLLFQVMLELGVELSAKIEEKDILGKKCYFVNDNDIAACFDDDLTNELLTELAKTKPLYAVFKDSCFNNDSVAINNEQIFKTYSPSTKVKVL